MAIRSTLYPSVHDDSCSETDPLVPLPFATRETPENLSDVPVPHLKTTAKLTMAVLWLNQWCHVALELFASLLFLRVPSRRWKKLALVPSLLAAAGIIYALCMHFYLMKHYWLNKTVSSSVGLFAEALLYLSAAFTYPLMITYLRKHNFTPILSKGVLALPCIPAGGDIDWSQWLRKQELSAATLEDTSANGQLADDPASQGAGGETRDHEDELECVYPTDSLVSSSSSRRRADYGTTGHGTGSGCEAPIERDRSGNHREVLIDIHEPACDRRCGYFYTTDDLGYCTLWTLGAALVGIVLASSMVTFDLGYERIFDEAHIRTFFKNDSVSRVERGFYWMYVWFVFYGVYASVMACCVFHSLSLVERRAMAAAAVVLQTKKTLKEARELVDEVRKFLEVMSGSMSHWFIVHSACFFILLALMCYEWMEASHKHINDNVYVQMWGSQLVSSGMILFKFVFPMWSASRVTQGWNKAVLTVNCSRSALSGGLADQQALVSYMKRCKGGFVVFSIRVTDNLLLIVGSALVAVFQVLRTIRTHY